MTSDSPLSLMLEGDPATRADWEKAAAAVLRKARRVRDDEDDSVVWDRLTRTTLDGVAVTPLGFRDEALDRDAANAVRPTRAGDWDVRVLADEEATAEEVVAELETGATSIWLRGEPARALEGVLLDLAPVILDPTDDRVGSARAFCEYAADQDLHPDTNLGADAGTLAEIAELATSRGVRAGVVDATGIHEAGGSDAQEVGFALALGAAHLRILTAAGHDLAAAAHLIEFRFAATDEQFPTIAKLRAARRTWARVLELSGLESDRTQRQHVVTSRPMLSKYDPYVNMLRTTVAAFAAGVGGADAVTVVPFDSPLGRPVPFGRRIARNQSSLLIHESHVAAVADPAGGAYAIERLTDDLARAAWAELQAIDGEPGDPVDGLAALPALAERIAAVVVEREAQIADRSRPLTGLTEFPNLAEELPARSGRADQVRRYGAAFEALRDEPAQQAVFLATMGPVAAHTARATFVTNLLAAGGIGVDPAGATASVDDVVARYDGRPVVCLAGADPAYTDWGADLITALREAGARYVLLAGRAGDLAVDDSFALGANAYEFLTRTREALR